MPEILTEFQYNLLLYLRENIHTDNIGYFSRGEALKRTIQATDTPLLVQQNELVSEGFIRPYGKLIPLHPFSIIHLRLTFKGLWLISRMKISW